MSQDITTDENLNSNETQKAAELDSRKDIAAQALKHARQQVVKAQIQFAKAKRAKNSLKDRETILLQDEQRWTHRAKTMASESEQKALDCLAHGVRCKVRLTQIRENLLAQEALESRLFCDFQTCKSRLDSLAEQNAEPEEHFDVANALEALENSKYK